nr:MAG TPA: hypothetical protein [Caudoviricetes sp.]
MSKSKDKNIFIDGEINTKTKTSNNKHIRSKDVYREIAQIVVELGDSAEVKNSRLEAIYKRLNQIYSDGNRHSYSIISASIKEKARVEGNVFLDKLEENTETFYQVVEKNSIKNPRNLMSFNKLYDHIKLECNRMSYISEVKDELAKQQKELADQQKIVGEDVKQALDDTKTLYANMISIISVFVAIFALITVNANISFKLTTYNMNEVFWGIIVVNIFVMLCIIALLLAVRLLIINKLTGK